MMIAEPATGALEFEEETHTYRLDGRVLPSVTTILEQLDPMYAVANLEEYAIRGTIIHDACQYHDEGCLEESAVPEDYIGYLRGWQKFRADCPFEVIKCEWPFANEAHQYAGRIDRVVDMFGVGKTRGLTVLDIKSGAERVTHRLQTAAYAEGYFSVTRQKVKKRACVYLHDDGSYSVKWHDDPNDWYDFAAMLRVARWRERNK